MSFVEALKDTARTVADAAVDTMRDYAEEMQRREALSTGAHQFHRSHEQDRGPPKLESGYYSTGKMVGFGSDGSSSNGGLGAAHSGVGAGGRGGGAYSDRPRYDSRSAYDRDERSDRYPSRDDRSDRWGARGDGHDGRSGRSWSEDRAAPPPKIESGYYSTGKMKGFGSDDFNRDGRSSHGSAYAGSGGSYGRDGRDYGSELRGGYANRSAYDRDERGYRESPSSSSSYPDRYPSRFPERYPDRFSNSGGAGAGRAGDSSGGGGGGGDRRYGINHDDDDGHGPDAWTSQIEIPEEGAATDDAEEQRRQRLKNFKINSAGGAPEPPSRPHPLNLAMPKGPAGRPRPQSGAPTSFDANVPTPEANLLDLEESPPPADPFAGGIISDLDALNDLAFDTQATAPLPTKATTGGVQDPFASISPVPGVGGGPPPNVATTAGAFGVDNSFGTSGGFGEAGFGSPSESSGFGGASFGGDTFGGDTFGGNAFGSGGFGAEGFGGSDFGGDDKGGFNDGGFNDTPSSPAAATAAATGGAGGGSGGGAFGESRDLLSLFGGSEQLSALASPANLTKSVPGVSNTAASVTSNKTPPQTAPAPPPAKPDALTSMVEKSLTNMVLGGEPAPAPAPAPPKAMGLPASAKTGGTPSCATSNGMGMGAAGIGLAAGPSMGMNMGGSVGISMGVPAAMPNMAGAFTGGGMGMAAPAPPMPGGNFCSNCGARRTGGNFCSNCGAKVA